MNVNSVGLKGFDYFSNSLTYSEAKEAAEKEMQNDSYDAFAIVRREVESDKNPIYEIYLRTRK